MKTVTKTSKFFDKNDKEKIIKFMKEKGLAIGTLADWLDISTVYLYAVIDGQRAVTKKLEEKLKNIGYELWDKNVYIVNIVEK